MLNVISLLIVWSFYSKRRKFTKIEQQEEEEGPEKRDDLGEWGNFKSTLLQLLTTKFIEDTCLQLKLLLHC